MSDKPWKACERRIAKYIGGERVPITGRQRGDAPDIKHEHLSVEVKYRKNIPNWIEDAMRQAEASQVMGQLPVTILVEKGQKAEDALVVVRLKDFRDWYV